MVRYGTSSAPSHERSPHGRSGELPPAAASPDVGLIRLCVVPGCGELTTSARCNGHMRKQDAQRGSTYERGYDADWRRVRVIVLGRDDYRCQLRLTGCTGLATTADHIVPLSAGGERLDLRNLQAACSHCNTAKGGRNHHRPVWAT